MTGVHYGVLAASQTDRQTEEERREEAKLETTPALLDKLTRSLLENMTEVVSRRLLMTRCNCLSYSLS